MSSAGVYIGLLALLATLTFAWVKGGAAEREAAMALGVAWLISLSLQALEQSSGRVLALVICDFALAVAFLVITIRHSSAWVGASMLVQAFSFAVHAQFLQETEGGAFRTYILALNLASIALLLTIIGGTIRAWVKRAGKRRAAAAAAATADVPAAEIAHAA